MKMLGVEWIISLSAVGSLKQEHKPLEFVIPDQFFDRTNGRVSTAIQNVSWRGHTAMAVQGDGRIIMAGTAEDGGR